MARDDEIRALIGFSLRKQPPFAGLSDEQVAQIASVSLESDVPPGEVFYRQGDPAAGFYIVVSGSVRLVEGIGADGSGGRDLGRLTSGACFGDMDVLEDSARPVTAIAVGTVTIIAISRHDFEGLLGSNPSLALSIMLSLVKHISPEGDEARRGPRGKVN